MDSDLGDMSDEELVSFLEFHRKSLIYMPFRKKFIEHFNEIEFYDKFHMSKSTALFVLNKISSFLEPPQSNKNNPIPPETMLLLTLSFLAGGGMLGMHAEHFGVSQATANRIVKKVLQSICSLRSKHIHLPKTLEDINKTVEGFYNIAEFPKVVAALGTSHVRIQSPGGDFSHTYLNTNTFYSLKVQMLCDADFRIFDVVVCPGGMSDKTIFENSKVFEKFNTEEFRDKLIVADDTYPNKPYFMKPLQLCLTSQRQYHDAQIATRKPIEETFLLWKRRFPVLVKGLWININTIEEMAIATAILHNICCEQNEYELPPIESEIETRIQTTMSIRDYGLDSPGSIDEHMEEMIEHFRNQKDKIEKVPKNEMNKTTEVADYEDDYLKDMLELFEN